jgi:stage II sporulation protein P
MIIINIGVNMFLNSIDKDKLSNSIYSNSFGNLFKSNNMFYKNVFGLPFNDTKVNGKVEEPIIYLYNTFQTDKYVNPYYSSYSINPVVTQGNLILQEYLKKLNINSLVEKESVAKTLKDNNIEYTLSYKGSRILMEKAKNNNQSLEYFFDIGISEDKRDVTTYVSDKGSFAKILFIVGTDYEAYEENKRFASILNDKLVSINKNISRGISIRGGSGYHGVYNQDFSTKALRIFIGGKENTIDEVNRSLKILASVIADYIKEEAYEKK